MIHGNLGVTLAQQGKLEPAAAEYRKSLAIKPDQPDVSYNLGVAEFKQGHFSAAIPAFELVAKEKPEDHRSTVLLGMSHFGLRDYAKASQYLQKATARTIPPIWSCTTFLRRVVYGATSTSVP